MHRLLNDAELDILREVAFFGFLTKAQLVRLRYRKSDNHAGEMLRRLAERRYLDYQMLPARGKKVPLRTPYIYWLTERGKGALRESGMALPPQPRHMYTPYPLQHTLAVNEFFIAARCLARDTAGVELLEHEHDRQLKKRPYVAELAGARKPIAPDGYLHFRVNGRDFPVILEVDKGTEDREQWQEKIRHLAAFIAGGYERRYKTTDITVAIVAHLEDPRLAQARAARLYEWTQAILLREGRRGDVFQFTHHRPEAVPAERYFFSKHWQVPFREGTYPLLEL